MHSSDIIYDVLVNCRLQFDYGAAVSYYELDLAIPEERHVMITLLKCRSTPLRAWIPIDLLT